MRPALAETRGFFARYSVLILFGFLIASPVLVYWAGRAVGTNSNQVADWLPAHMNETAELEKFNAWFGDGQFVVVSWDGCRIDLASDPDDASGDDPRLAKMQQLMSSQSDPNNRLYVRKVVTSRTLLQTLTSAPLDISRSDAVRRLTGSVIGREGQACMIVFLRDVPSEQLRQAIGFWKSRWIERLKSGAAPPQGMLFASLADCGIPLDSVHLGGPPVDNLAINEEGQRTLLRLALAAGALGLCLSWWSLRSIRLTIIVFACGIISTCGATAAIWVSNCHADAIVLAMPSLIYVLTISGAIHLINYYRVAVEETGIPTAAGRAIAMGAKPATLCSVTTAMGLLSLFASDLTPIRRFGIFSALGMLLMLAVLFLLLPAALHVLGRRDGFGLSHPKQRRTRTTSAPTRGHQLKTIWVQWLIRRHRWVCLASVITLAVLAAGIPKVRTSVDLLKLFDGKTRILADYHWLEDNLGNLVPLEILLRFDQRALGNEDSVIKDGELSMLGRVQVVDQVRHAIDARFGDHGEQLISTPMSALAFLPVLPSDYKGVSGIVRRRATDGKLRQSREALVDSGYLAIDPDSGDEVWRISLRAAAFKDVDYGMMAEHVRDVVDPIMSQVNAGLQTQPDLPSVSAIHTGAIPIVYKAQRELLQSLIESTMWSFLTITPLLMWVTRGVFAGTVAMFPNLFPVVAVFGTMGWLGIPVDIGCMMTASIALGVAVDDTIHFLHWHRHCQEHAPTRNGVPTRNGASTPEGVIEAAFHHCCDPTLQAAVINGLGLSVFLLSTFVPTRQFGLLMLVILTCGSIAELVLLPAILASPLGRLFDIRHRSPIFDGLRRRTQQAMDYPSSGRSPERSGKAILCDQLVEKR